MKGLISWGPGLCGSGWREGGRGEGEEAHLEVGGGVEGGVPTRISSRVARWPLPLARVVHLGQGLL